MSSSSQGPEASAGSALEGCEIFVVQGSTGEYSDRSEWLVRAFHSEVEAKGYVEFLGVERQKLGPNPADWEDDTVEAAMRAFDPHYREDYTGTSWFYAAVKLAPSSANQTPEAASGTNKTSATQP